MCIHTYIKKNHYTTYIHTYIHTGLPFVVVGPDDEVPMLDGKNVAVVLGMYVGPLVAG